MNDAVYYSRREATESELAAACTDPKVREVHLILARKYAELAKRELSRMSLENSGDGPSVSAAAIGHYPRPRSR